MKRIIPIFAVVLGLTLSSCLDTKSHYTPEISLSQFYTGSGDSLLFMYDEMAGMYRVDSLLVGDTLHFSVGFASLGNNMVSTHIDWDTNYVDMWGYFTQDMLDVMLPTSDTATLDIYLPVGYNYVGLPLWIVPKKAGGTLLKFTAVSDSKYSPKELPLMLGIVTE